MINHNLLMYELFDKKFSVNYGGKDWLINYAEGDLFELANILNDKVKANQLKYPMIWLQSGYSVQRDKALNKIKLMGCKFFIIILGDANTRYEQRYQGNFDKYLYKILLKFDKTIDRTRGVSASMIDDIRTFPLNDIAELTSAEKGQKTTIQDIWDAIELSTDIEINNECFPHLKINL